MPTVSFFLPVARMQTSLFAWLLFAMICGCTQPAPLESPEAHSSADALYTAITSRRQDLMSEVETRLMSLNKSGKLSQTALNELTEIISIAKAEKWQNAAERLDTFIRNQPPHDHAH
jgi:hypothetical protein